MGLLFQTGESPGDVVWTIPSNTLISWYFIVLISRQTTESQDSLWLTQKSLCSLFTDTGFLTGPHHRLAFKCHCYTRRFGRVLQHTLFWLARSVNLTSFHRKKAYGAAKQWKFATNTRTQVILPLEGACGWLMWLPVPSWTFCHIQKYGHPMPTHSSTA